MCYLAFANSASAPVSHKASTSNAITPVATYQFDLRTSVRFQYSFRILRSDSSTAKDSDTHEATTALQYQFTPRTSGDMSYTFSRFLVEGSYERNAGVAGLTGVTSVTQSLTTAASYQPIRFLTLAVDASLAETESSGSSSTRVDFLTFLGSFRISYQLLRWLSVEASYRYQKQDDRAGSQDLQKNVFFLGLTATDQFRLR